MRKWFGACAALLLLTCVAGAHAQSDDGLLPVTRAFALKAQVAAPGTLQLNWVIAPHYYLYRGRIKITSASKDVTLGTPILPDGLKEHDTYLGDVEIYHHALHASVPYTSHGADTLKLAVRFQGCHEVDPKICYPPHTQTFNLKLPAAATAAAASSPNAAANPFASAPSSLTTGTRAQPLPPAKAFEFEAIAASPTSLLLRWIMPPHYYLYRHKTTLTLQDANGVSLGTPQWPKGVQHKDENFGTTEVYFNEVDVTLPLQRQSGGAQTITLQAQYQGCQENGICYPLMTRTLAIALPAAAAAQSASAANHASNAPATTASQAATPTTSANATSNGVNVDQDRLTHILRTASLWLVLLTFFVAGLGLAFTPCVYPMLPILTGIIAGAGEHLSTRRAIVLSLVYVLANAVVFAIAGVIAGLLGFNLTAWFQQPWLLSLFALLFVLLALGMFGFYELQLPASWQARISGASNRQKAGSLTGVAVMGALSALIVGPCVTPALAVAIGTIGQSGSPLLGGSALFALGLGMGAPLIVFGATEGKLLPRAGGWMDAVKAVFGVAFLGIAIWMLARFLDPLWIMLMSGALLVACGVYLGAFERLTEGSSGWRKLWKALGIIILIIGAAELVGAAAGSRDVLQPLHGLRGTTSQTIARQKLDFARIRSSADLDRAIAAAKVAGKPLMFDFYADWCVACKEMERVTFRDPAVKQALAGFSLVQADVTANNADDKGLLKRFGLYGPPATIFFEADGKEQRDARLIGFEAATRFVQRIHMVSPSS